MTSKTGIRVRPSVLGHHDALAQPLPETGAGLSQTDQTWRSWQVQTLDAASPKTDRGGRWSPSVERQLESE